MRIQQVPRGLLDWLNLRSEGRTPDELLPNVRPQIDLSGFYDVEKIDAVTVAVNSAPGGIDSIEVPSNEVWKILALGVVGDPLAAATARTFRWTWLVERLPTLGVNGAAFHTSPLIEHPATDVATSVPEYSHSLAQPRWVASGKIVAIRQDVANDAAGNSVSFSGDAMLTIVRYSV